MSQDARDVANWVTASGDNRGLPFIVVDKVSARLFVFDGQSRILGTAPALLGLGRGDDTVPGIGQRKLATIRPAERTTPAGRFEAALGHDLEQDILWVNYGAALSLHRVIVGKPADRRHARLASVTPLDNRISYGCINVPAHFYDNVVAPAFKGTVGIVYILPETKPITAVFAMHRSFESSVVVHATPSPVMPSPPQALEH
ncbi:MAG: L,D-transpeptidase [Alphaproteobacteria bacterium]|nr:L,D-transpeptidase [Alphaproteobacteria bacterium]